MTPLDEAYRAHRPLLWGLSYRILGVASEADEVVQETFVRALERRPSTDRPLRPWLVRVASNLSRDRLRRRRRRSYDGPWLPSPVDDAALEPVERRSELGYAWLVALEALTPNQRAVLVLREALDLSVDETAEALDLSPSNVKVTLHRARRALSDVRSPDPPEVAAPIVARFVGALASGELDRVLEVLASDAVAVSDGGGRYHAARRPVVGADRVARLLVGLFAKSAARVGAAELTVRSGLPALVVELRDPPPGIAPRSVLVFEVEGGQVRRIWSVLAPDKLG